MKINDIIALMNCKIEVEEFFKSIEKEVDKYKKGIKKLGASVNIYVEGHDVKLPFLGQVKTGNSL
jgi:SMC interacting uncharacterized protein involved in chromosome segregation